MTEKQKLALHFAWDCFFIALFPLSLMTHARFFYVLISLNAAIVAFLSRGKPTIKKQGRELNTLEVLIWFAIGFSALWILFFALYKGFLVKPAVLIPIGIIGLAARSLWFAQDWAALKNSPAAQ